MAAEQTEGAEARQKIDLLFLPPSVLRRIFAEQGTISFANLILCKTLMPHTLQALYANVQLLRRPHVAKFAASVRTKPSLLSCVREFGISDSERFPAVDDHAWDRDSGDVGAGQVIPADGQGVPYDASSVVVGLGLLKDLCSAFEHLDILTLGGKPFRSILSTRYLQKNPFPSLRNLLLMFVYDEDFDTEDTLFHRLALLPPLANCSFQFLLQRRNTTAPLPLLNLAPQQALRPRSWSVETLDVANGGWAAPEYRYVFAGLSESCKKVSLAFTHVAPSFASDLAFLPSSLTALILSLGTFCEGGGPPPRANTLPRLNDTLSHLVNLKHLHLLGDIVDAASFPTIARFAHLECLLLGSHTSYSLSDLSPLFARSEMTPPLPPLGFLTVHVCPYCYTKRRAGTREVKFARVYWPRCLPRADAVDLVERDGVQGMSVDGTMRCALGMCTPTERHLGFCTKLP
ncbi:hypothetical protein JCM6882_007102 [Rhodosporidiobolus microsporus]